MDALLSTLRQQLLTLRNVDDDMSTAMILSLIEVMCEEGEDMQAVADRIGVPYTTVTQCFSGLDVHGRGGKPGLSLVRAVVDPECRRRKVLTLTPKGRKLRQRLIDIAGQGKG